MSFISDFFFVKPVIQEESKSVTLKAVFEIGDEQEVNDEEIEAESEDSEFDS